MRVTPLSDDPEVFTKALPKLIYNMYLKLQ